MTYQKDGSPFHLSRGQVNTNILYYGWLSSAKPFEQRRDRQDYLIFQKLADSVKHVMTRGHHQCEFCGWEDAGYGNGEMWLKIGHQTCVFPRMIWHYIKQHDYNLPEEIYSSINSGSYEILTEQMIAQLHSAEAVGAVNVPYLICRAMWQVERYKDMGEFFRRNQLKWNFNQASIDDGYYTVETHNSPSQIETLFADNLKNFPDKVLIEMKT